jgi:hypothetical protein
VNVHHLIKILASSILFQFEAIKFPTKLQLQFICNMVLSNQSVADALAGQYSIFHLTSPTKSSSNAKFIQSL